MQVERLWIASLGSKLSKQSWYNLRLASPELADLYLGPPQVSQTNTNATRRPPVPGATGRFDNNFDNLMRSGLRADASPGDIPNQTSRLHQPPWGNPHVAASPADASRNHPRKRLETPREFAFRLCNEFGLEYCPWVNVIMNEVRQAADL